MEAISMKEPAEKLRNKDILSKMNAATDHFFDFTNFLATRLEASGELLPMGFAMAVELVINDLTKGIDGYTGAPLNNRLVGMPPMIFGLMKRGLYRHLKLVLPEDFANEVLKFEEEVQAEIKKKAAQPS